MATIYFDEDSYPLPFLKKECYT